MIKEITSKVLKVGTIKWKDLQFIQDDNFKEWIDNGDEKLINSLMKYQFVDPFKVWENDGNVYCLDGKHRTLDLSQLIDRGVTVPEELPAIFLDCKNIDEAAELVLVYSSAYSKITQQGLFDFAEKFSLNLPSMETINLPDLQIDCDLPAIPDVLTSPLKNNPPVIKISFADEKQMSKFENKLKEILKDFEGSTYSVSLGEM